MESYIKYLLAVICLLLVSITNAQDSLVCIKPSTARYYLEVEDERWILREKDSISNSIIFNQANIIDTKDKIIHLYKQDSSVYQKREKALTSHIELVRQELIKSDKEIRKQKRIKWGVIGLAVLAALFL